MGSVSALLRCGVVHGAPCVQQLWGSLGVTAAAQFPLSFRSLSAQFPLQFPLVFTVFGPVPRQEKKIIQFLYI